MEIRKGDEIMSEKASIRVHDDKRGKTHIDAYSNDPKSPHDTIHINIPNNGSGGAIIVEKFGGEKTISAIKFDK